MMKFLEDFRAQAEAHPDRRAYFNTAGEALTYGELLSSARGIAAFLLAENPGKNPVALYGHKQPSMLASILGCLFAGCPYVPLDTMYPDSRIEGIVGQLHDPFVVCAAAPQGDFGADGHVKRVVLPDELAAIQAADPGTIDEDQAADGADTSYILFTSGSTGTPKGVMQRADALDALCRYMAKFIPVGEAPQVHFNRAPFCFDMSLKNVLTALPHGHTIFSLEESAEESMKAIFEAFAESQMTLWFSTPTFVEMCLADPAFTGDLLPDLRAMVLGGETLHASLALRFMDRFPKADIYNVYGPTETCVMVSDVLLTRERVEANEALPIGAPAPGTQMVIVDHETHEDVPDGQNGEICIVGDQVGAGYYEDPQKTAASFTVRTAADGTELRAYYSGDEGYIGEDGLVYYLGRFDKQVKIRGFRVELGEIEEALNALDQVASCCVLAVSRRGSNVALQAHVVAAPGLTADRELGRALKAALKETLPDYMVPGTFKFHDALPTNVNGKVDRAALERSMKRR